MRTRVCEFVSNIPCHNWYWNGEAGAAAAQRYTLYPPIKTFTNIAAILNPEAHSTEPYTSVILSIQK